MADTYTVVRGDTLWGIAQRFLGSGTKYTYLAQINGIRNPNLIYVGQVIKLNSGGYASAPSKPPTKPKPPEPHPMPVLRPEPETPNIVTITQFGHQSNTDRSIFATWSWAKANTKEYEAKWWYDSGDGVWFVGSDSTTKEKQSIYNAPSNAKRVKFQCKPISTTHKVNDKDVSYWSGQWSTAKIYTFTNAPTPPPAPSTPTVSLNGFKLTASLANIDATSKRIQFQVVRNDASIFKTALVNIRTSAASFSCSVNGGSRYKVRARAERNGLYSTWSDYSNNYTTIPNTPSRITSIKALSSTSVYLGWTAANNAENYIIEYTTNSRYFDSSNEVKSMTVGSNVTHAEVTGLETGLKYFFRVRAKNAQGNSGWTAIKSVVIGKKPSAPTTWSSTTTAMVGETVKLYWLHNSEDNSDEKYAELELTINGKKEVKTIKNESTNNQGEPKVYSLATSAYTTGTIIKWRVRTSGITNEYSNWSVQRTIEVYAPATLEIKVTDADDNQIDVLNSFPFFVYGIAGPSTQTPIGYHVSISSNSTYHTTDAVGNPKTVSKGEVVYNNYFDVSSSLLVKFTPGIIDLANNVTYTVKVAVSMNTGLSAEASDTFKVSWSEIGYAPNASISIDRDTLSAYIHPYCSYYATVNYKVDYDSAADTYTETTEKLSEDTEGVSIDDYVLPDGRLIYKTTDGVYFSQKQSTTASFIQGVTLSVYRREFDGSFTEIGSGIANNSHSFVTDPHPSLDYARYRIVSTTTSTGAIAYYDVPGVPVGEQGIVIQWDEEWSQFDTTEETEMEQPPWSGSMLKLPYNVDISDSHDPDASLIEYIGRKNPVGYYGTQVGYSSTWKCDIVKEDVETLYAIRRLSVWMGDVYVRESSGTGYWANIKVDYDRNHKDVIIPVTFTVKRVEGGI